MHCQGAWSRRWKVSDVVRSVLVTQSYIYIVAVNDAIYGVIKSTPARDSQLLNQNIDDVCTTGDIVAVKKALWLEHSIDAREHPAVISSAIYAAAHCGHLQLLQWFFYDMKCDLNLRNSSNSTLLHIACSKGSVSMVRWLVLMGADVTVCDQSGQTPLHLLAIEHVDTFSRHFLEIIDPIPRADVDIKNTNQCTLLHAVCASASLTGATLLLNRGANVKAVSRHQKNVLHFAAAHGSVQLVEYLMNQGVSISDIDSDGNNSLMYACETGNHEVVAAILKADPSSAVCVNKDGDTCLHIACANSRHNIIGLIVEYKSLCQVVNKLGDSPLASACKTGDIETMLQLTNYFDGDVSSVNNVTGQSLLHVTAGMGYLPLSKWLVERGVDMDCVDKDHMTPFLVAVENGHLPLLIWLYDSDEINIFHVGGKDMNQALHLACLYQHKEVAEWLLKIGLSSKAMNRSGKVPLDIAHSTGNQEMIELFAGAEEGDEGPNVIVGEKRATAEASLHALEGALAKGDYLFANQLLVSVSHLSSPTDVFAGGKTLLHFAASTGSVNMAQYLIISGCQVNAFSSNLRNPFHYACHHGQLEVAKYLHSAGADIFAVDVHGYSPLSIVLRRHRHDPISSWVQGLLVAAAKPLDPSITSGNKSPKTKWSLFPFSCISNHTDVANADVAPVDVEGNTDSSISIQNQQIDSSELLVNACRCGNFSKVKQIFESNIAMVEKLRSGNDSILFDAVYSNNEQLVQFLLDHRFDPNSVDKTSSTPLHLACKLSYGDIALRLVKGGSSLEWKNGLGETPLHTIVRNGMLTLFLRILDLPRSVLPRLDLGLLDAEGSNLLHIAVKAGSVGIAEELLQGGDILVNAVDSYGRTCLHVACLHNISDVLPMLRKSGVEVNIPDDRGYTAFHYACVSGNVEMAQWLVREGALMHLISNDGDNALHISAAVGDLPLVQWLVGCGLDLKSRNNYEMSPYELALYRHKESVVQWVEKNFGVSSNKKVEFSRYVETWCSRYDER